MVFSGALFLGVCLTAVFWGAPVHAASCYYTDQDDYICDTPPTPGEPVPPSQPSPAPGPSAGSPPPASGNRPEYVSTEECTPESLGSVEEAFRRHVVAREGRRNDVYKDSEGYLTVGIGHLVLPEDNLKLGDVISDERLEELYQKDSKWALDAARQQSAEAGGDDCFVVALANVNFQLGAGWRTTFPNTWAAIKGQRYLEAAEMLNGTLWQRQTPTRVADFQKALRDLDERKKSGSGGSGAGQ